MVLAMYTVRRYSISKKGVIAEFRVSNSLCGQSRQRSKSVPKESAIHIHYTDISSSKLAALRNIFRNFFLRMDFIVKQVVIYGGQLEKIQVSCFGNQF